MSPKPSTGGVSLRRSPNPEATRSRPTSTRCPTRPTSTCSRSTQRRRREKFLVGADPVVRQVADRLDDDALHRLVTDLGGHDLGVLLDTFRSCDAVTDRPSVVFAYTIKGHGLPIAGDPMNHAALLSPEQIDDLRTLTGLDGDTEWDRFDPDSPAGRRCASVGGAINNEPTPPRPIVPVPAASRQPGHERFDLDPGSIRAGAGQPGRRRRRRRPSRDHGARRVDLDEPRRVHQQARRVLAHRTRRPRRRRSSAQVGALAERAAHRARHQRDEPVHAARPARAQPRPSRPSSAPRRRRVRPVRAAWSRRVHLRHLQRRQVRRRRYARRCHPRTRGRCAPVDDHRVGRRRAAEPHLQRTGLRHRGRLVAVRRARPALATPRHEQLSPFVDPPDRPGTVRRCARTSRRGRAAPPGPRRRLPTARGRHRRC